MKVAAGTKPEVAVRKVAKRRSASDEMDLWLGFTGPLGMRNRISFYNDLAAFTEQGLTPIATVHRLNKVAVKRRSLKWLKLVTDDLIKSSKEGYPSFGAQLARVVDPNEAAMVATGEAAGQFPEAMRMLSSLVGQQAAITSEIWGLIRNVAIYAAIAMSVVVVVAKLLAPKFVSITTPATFAKLSFAPWFLGLCSALMDWWIPVVLVLISCVLAIIGSLKRWKPSALRSFADEHVAPWSVYSRARSSLFLATLATSLSSGGQFKATLQTLHDSSSGWERAHMRRMLTRLAGNGGVPAAMGAGFLSRDVMDRLSIYLSANGFETILNSLAKDSLDGLLKSVRRVGRIGVVGSILLAVAMLGAVVGSGAEIAINGMSGPGASL
jgi:type II secretory pathway component PulF